MNKKLIFTTLILSMIFEVYRLVNSFLTVIATTSALSHISPENTEVYNNLKLNVGRGYGEAIVCVVLLILSAVACTALNKKTEVNQEYDL